MLCFINMNLNIEVEVEAAEKSVTHCYLPQYIINVVL